MSKTLVAFASKQEFSALFPKISAVVASSTPQPLNSALELAVCGVGLLDFSVNLAQFLSQGKYDRVVLVGVCGAYPGRGIGVGEVVRVDSEIVGDIGVQTREGHFVPWGDVSGATVSYRGDSPRFLTLPLATVRSVSGVTVNCCTGTAYLASRRSALFDADVETMEGAACFAVCKRFGVSGYQFRAVSNIATDRDTSAWRIPEALKALKEQVLDNL
ncbi:futalosine hydrolase [uncultured Fibrobacter sp.]|uniref:futalosine hydrolase n=1 Tax=uncultured Fibrobacter sp. TaxID=261512 RepID=UPI001563CDF8|nr:futalosine hydrolase [uncultured Fibrobacter sp.]